MSVSNILSQVWCHSSFFLAIIGNSYVLYATVEKRAIQLDRLSIWIIQNLAVFDLLNAILILIPVIISLYADSQWILGDTLCKVTYTYKYFGFTANVVLINMLSLNKMVCCLAPLKRLGSSALQKCSITTITVLLSAVIPAYSCFKTYAKDEFTILFTSSQCMCSSVQVKDAGNFHKIFYSILAGTLNGLPCLTLLGSNTFLLIYAVKKTKRAVNKKKIAIVVMVTFSFLISIFPYFVYSIKHGNTHNTSENDNLLRFVTFAPFTALWANPVIYLLTNENFRRFTVDSLRELSRASTTRLSLVEFVFNERSYRDSTVNLEQNMG